MVIFTAFTRFLQPFCFLLFTALLCNLPSSASPSPSTVCTHGVAPVHLPDPLAFCGNAGLISCCDAAADAALREEFQAMNVPESDAACTAIAKAILCAACMPASTSPSQQQPVNAATIRRTTIPLPPHCTASSPPLPPSTSAPAQPYQDASSLCLERLDAGTYLGMVALPDGSGRALLYTHDSNIRLASVPTVGSGAALRVDDAPFLDLSDRALRITGLALHPRFANNGRFFVSYVVRASATGAAGNGSRHHQLVLEEFSAKQGVHYHGMATLAAPNETRRILFTTGLPQHVDMNPSDQQHAYGGQILTVVGPRPGGHDRSSSDLYLVKWYGGGDDEATGNKNTSSSSFLGKIVRFNIDDDGMAPAQGGTEEPDVFVTGLDDPRGCSFDSERPTDLYCAGLDHEQRKEQVYLISIRASSAKAAAVSLIISHGRLAAAGGPSSIVGGLVYRGSADPLLHGRYLYIYGSAVWAVAADTTTPAISSVLKYVYASGKILHVMCSANSPVPCGGGGAIDGVIISLGQDSSNDVFFIATGGIYRVIPPALCAAARGRPRAPAVLPPQQMPSWLKWWAGTIGLPAMLLIWWRFFFCYPRLFFGGGGDDSSSQPAAATTSYNNCMCNCCLPAVYVTNNNYGAT